MKTRSFLPLILTSLLVAGCAENPADSVPAAEVSDSSPDAASAPADGSASPAPAAGDAGVTYVFTDESKIEFIGSKVTGSHSGGFKAFRGTFVVAGDKPGPGPHRIEIDMASTWSDDERLTEHLKSADFFDVENHPVSVFELNDAAEAEGDNAYVLSGDFTLHGVTKQISFPATVTKGDDGILRLESEFSINRKDFGIVFPGRPDDLIRDEVVIKLAMVASAQG